MAKTAFFFRNFNSRKIDFTQNLGNRKIKKFLHRVPTLPFAGKVGIAVKSLKSSKNNNEMLKKTYVDVF